MVNFIENEERDKEPTQVFLEVSSRTSSPLCGAGMEETGKRGKTEEAGGAAVCVNLAPSHGSPSIFISPVSNADFVNAIFPSVPNSGVPLVCTKAGDPGLEGWLPLRASTGAAACGDSRNNYLNCSAFLPEQDGSVHAKKDRFAACHAVMLDDVGTKVPLARLKSFPPSWLLETSPGNYQAGFMLHPPITDAEDANLLSRAIIAAGLCDPGAGGAATRWMRLPVGINGKPKHKRDGVAFSCRLIEWHPDRRYSRDSLIAGLGLDIGGRTMLGTGRSPVFETSRLRDRAVFVPKAPKNAVLAALEAQGLYKKRLDVGKHDVKCPWVDEHTDGLDNGAAYFEPSAGYPDGGFRCQHSHGSRYHLGDLLKRLGLSAEDARNLPVINVLPGHLDAVVNAAELALSSTGKYYQAGGLIVSIGQDPLTGLPAMVPITVSELTRELSTVAIWRSYKGSQPIACDPPIKHLNILHDTQTYSHLPKLVGLAHQPYFRESDGALICQPGYEPTTLRYGIFDPADFRLPEPTEAEARAAMRDLESLLSGFHFARPADKAAALAAIFTAVVRPSLPVAPGFHVHASVYASGKTYLCELIGAFAGEGPNLKASYPKNGEEATKIVLSMLMSCPPVIEFDDMDSDWIPYATIKQMLTAEEVAGRVLGISKMARVSTRCLVLGSGNNVVPLQDMRRRILTIHLDARCETPATLQYGFDPVRLVRANRGVFVSKVLSVIQAWRAAGMPRSVPDFATYGKDWADNARHPLMWMGQPDPAANLLDQIVHDPDAEALDTLMTEWQRIFGSRYVTVRKVIAAACDESLGDALCELPVVEGREVNAKKLGWFLKRHINRIIKGRCIRKGAADSRTGWAVVSVLEQEPSDGEAPVIDSETICEVAFDALSP